MNKELYIKRNQQLEEFWKLKSLVDRLQTFLEENEKNFKREESIEAIKKIKVYFELKEKEAHESEIKEKEIYQELYSTCNHEVAIKYSNMFDYKCLICDCTLRWDSDKVPEKSLISIDTTKDYQVAYIIENIFKEVVYSDKDLIETISNALEEMQYDRNIKVYTRLK